MTISLFFFLGVSFLSRSPRSPPHCLLALQAGCTAVIQRLAFAALLSPSSAFPDSVSSKLVYALVLVEQTLQEFLYDRMHGGGGVNSSESLYIWKNATLIDRGWI